MAHESLLCREDSVLVIIDAQEKLLPAMHDSEAVCAAIRQLAEAAILLDVPVLITEQYPKGLGSTVAVLAEVVADAPRWSKMDFSGARCESFMDALEDLGRDQVVVCGLEAHICVLQTALDLAANGMQIHVPEDATASRDPMHRKNALRRMQQEGVVITNRESVLFEWLGVAGTDLFKRVSALVK